MVTRRGRLLFVIGALALTVACCSGARSQEYGEVRPSIELYIDTVFDSIHSNRVVFERYFSGARGSRLAALVSENLKRVIETKFADIAIDVSVVLADPSGIDAAGAGGHVYCIVDTIFMDAESSFNVNTTIVHAASGRRVKGFERMLKHGILERYDWWDELAVSDREASADQRARQILYEMATSLVAVIEGDIFGWIVESSVRIRVEVDDFTQIAGGEGYRYLEEALKLMVESELSRSEIIVVYAADGTGEPRGGGGPSMPGINYRIDGKFVEVGGQLRIDIRCIKEASSRILVSCGALVEAIRIEELSRKIKDITHRLKRAMEADFKQSVRTLAVVASPPVKLFSFETPASEDMTIAKEIVRAVTQKLRLLAAGTKDQASRLSLQVLDDPAKVVEYMNNPAEPADIIADLDVDYLVVISYEDLGNEIRISTNLFSYDVERLAFAKLIHETKGKKVYVNEAIDETVLALLESLCRSMLFDTSVPCGSLPKPGLAGQIRERISEVRMTDIRKNNGLGFRFGVTAHNDPALYAGTEISSYTELFYTRMIPDFHLVGFDFAFEPSVGLDFVDTRFPFNGVISVNSFISFKAVLLGFQYWKLPVIATFGVGAGIHYVRYRFRPGDRRYLGEQPFRSGQVEFATSVMNEMEFSVTDTFSFHSLVRYIAESEEITAFEDAEVDYAARPVGRMGGFYFACGFKYCWR